MLSTLLLAIALLFFAIAQSAPRRPPNNYPYMDAETSQRFAAGQAAIDALLQEFGENNEAIDGVNYPDDYGGRYFDKQGYLYIITTKENFDDISFLSDNPVIKDCVIYKYAPHSYKELRRLQVFLSDYGLDFGISYIGIAETQNVVGVGLLTLRNKEAILHFLRNNYKGFDESMVVFAQSERAVQLAN